MTFPPLGWPWSDSFKRTGYPAKLYSRWNSNYPNDVFTITAGSNDTLVFTIDGASPVTVTIPAGAIDQTGLVALLQANSTLASQVQIVGGDSFRLTLFSNTVPNGSNTSSIVVSGNAASMLFPTASVTASSGGPGDWNPSVGTLWTVSANGVISTATGSDNTTVNKMIWTRSYDSMAYAPEYYVQAQMPTVYQSGSVGLTLKDSYYGSGYLGGVFPAASTSSPDVLAVYYCKGTAHTIIAQFTATASYAGCFDSNGKWLDGSWVRLWYQLGKIYMAISPASDGVNWTTVFNQGETTHLEVRGVPGLRAKGAMQGAIRNWSCGPLSGVVSLQHPPQLGRQTPDLQAVTVCADQACTVTVVYDTANPPTAKSVTTAVTSATNFMGTLVMNGLSPATAYYYDVQLNGVSKSNGAYPSFKTLPAVSTAGQQLTIGFGSCHSKLLGPSPDTIYTALAAKSPHLFFHLGDLYYMDYAFVGVSGSYAEPPIMTANGYRTKIRLNHAISDGNFTYPTFYPKFPSYFMSDDHEWRNDYSDGRNTREYSSAESPWRELVGNGNLINTQAGETYYSFAHGDVGFFVMDQRAYRDPNGTLDAAVSNNAYSLTAPPSTWTISSTTNKLYVTIDGTLYTVTLTTGSRTAAQIVSDINAAIPGTVGGAWVGNLGCLYLISNKVGGGSIQISSGTNSAHSVLALDTSLHQPGKSMLGAAQKAQLKSWLLRNNSSLRIKCLVSETSWSGFATTTSDAWGEGFIGERNELWDFIIANGIKGVFVISGDQHWSAIFKTVRFPNQTVTSSTPTMYEWMSSPLGNAMRPLPTTTGGDPQSQIYSMQTASVNFGVCVIDTTTTPAKVTGTIYNASGATLSGVNGAGTSTSATLAVTETQMNAGLATSVDLPSGAI